MWRDEAPARPSHLPNCLPTIPWNCRAGLWIPVHPSLPRGFGALRLQEKSLSACPESTAHTTVPFPCVEHSSWVCPLSFIQQSFLTPLTYFPTSRSPSRLPDTSSTHSSIRQRFCSWQNFVLEKQKAALEKQKIHYCFGKTKKSISSVPTFRPIQIFGL